MKSSKNIYYIIGQNIKRIRKEKGITAFKLADKCNLSYGYIRNLEAKSVKATISIETLALIADTLNTDIVEFLKDNIDKH